MIDFEIQITGTVALLMHNAQLADPLNPYTKKVAEVASKRAKTDEDHAELARREWLGGLYYTPEDGLHVPGQNVERCLLDAARMNRLGKSIERGVFIVGNPALDIGQVFDPAKMVSDMNYRFTTTIVVAKRRVPRTRPMFRKWSLTASGTLDDSQLDMAELRSIANNAGRLVGLGDWRPRYGRFVATLTEL